MDFLQELGSHRGGLLLLKTELWWYGGRGWDGIRGRVCLLMDAADASPWGPGFVALSGSNIAAASSAAAVREQVPSTAAFLLVDGEPHWVWVAQADVELLS
jgi:hypothetical protein